jgi:hypothetical protein
MIGSRIGSWLIEEEIGRGGMGTVYRARRVAGDGPRLAAIKVLAAELAVEVGFQQRFQREINILKQLDHPGIVRFLESGSERNRYWFAMEFVDGCSFESLRDERGRVSWPEVLDLAWQIAPALKHAHDRGVIHRDLKPSNLMRTGEAVADSPGRIKLTDFGISSLFASPHLTVTGGVIGTPEYLSPEQAAGKQVTKKSDLYSLGVVLYTLITGDTPFQGDAVDLLHKHRYAQFDRPGRIVPELPPDFDEIICQLMAKDPGQRIPDAGVLHRRLDGLRRKLIRRAASRTESPAAMETAAGADGGDRIGPATFASRFVRQELEDQKHGGPVARFFNHPAVLVVLFVLVIGTLAWTFWPISAEGLYQRGAALMASDDPDDWERAFERFLDPLEERFPDHARKEEVATLREKLKDAQAERRAERAARDKAEMSEAHWFYEQGMRLRRQGDENAARAMWTRLVEAFADVPAERPWVRRAKQQLESVPAAPGDRLRSLREALAAAKKREQAGDADGAKAVRLALRRLYDGDAAAQKLINGE